MSPSPKISEFIARAKTVGASEQSIVGILTARGWPEKEIYEALAAHYEGVTGIEIPRRGSTGTAAKDAFFYLLIFSTLATWTVGLGWLAFTLIDRWLSDSLFSGGYRQTFETTEIASALASILVAFPIYLLVSRTVLRDESSHPEKLDSPVRRWLTYMALVIAACVFIGDLITALTYLLRGEITSRFLAKAFVVFVISGGVFFYYFGGVRKTEEAKRGGGLTRDARMAMLSAVTVAALVISGFLNIGTPRTQRTLRADNKRVQDLYQISTQIHARWNTNGHKLPASLAELPNVPSADPVTRLPYGYRVKDAGQYELCATFSLESSNDATSRPNQWSHPGGSHCFVLNTGEAAENPYVYVPD